MHQTMLEKDEVNQDIKNRYYDEDDYHMIYYGEITDSYLYK